MPPVVGVIVAIGSAIGGAIASVAVSAWAIAGTVIGNIVLNVGLSLAFSALFAPKKTSTAARQASILQLSLGEGPRQAIFGRAATGGSLADAWNDGGSNEFETLVVILADHECDALEGFFVNDKYYAFTADGPQTHADFQDGGSMLSIEFRRGAPNQTLPTAIANQGVAAGEFEGTDLFAGLTYVTARYHVSDKAWASGRPSFKWVLRGLRCYDPRLDSTVAGGSGPQRWGQPSTYVWSENARVCHYNYMRGVWNYAGASPQLMVGPGRSDEEMPSAEMIADANLCDEAVGLKAGGTEPRYRVGGVVSADEVWIDVEEHFAAAMGGELTERSGTIAVDMGAAKAPCFAFTDKDLIVGQEINYQGKVTRDELTNTVVAKYVAPDQLWAAVAAPLRRSQADIDEDGEPKEETLELVLVTSQTQAQRIAEIHRRKARLQVAASAPLGPRFMTIEPSDWGTWTSDRYFGGETRTFTVPGVAHGDDMVSKLALREIAASVYAWNPAVDEIDALAPAYLPPGAVAAAFIADFDVQPLEISGPDGASAGAIRATWTPPTDVTIGGLRLEYRPIGGIASTSITVDPQTGVYVIDVLPITDVDYEIRATPVVSPRRDTLTTAWRTVTLSAPFRLPEPPTGFTGFQNQDTIRFIWSPFADTTLRYEIRAGPTFDLGRFVDNVSGGSTTVQWPITSEDDEVLFWIKTVHRTGVYSDGASLWVASIGALEGRNFVLADDFQADTFPGVRHALTDSIADDLAVLQLDSADGSSQRYGDYYAEVSLLAEFRARAWLEQRASSFRDSLPTWDELGDLTWGDLGAVRWEPDLGSPGAARLDSYIAVSATPPASLIEGWRFKGSLTGINGATPSSSDGTSYGPARAANGVTLAEGGLLHYAPTLGQTVSFLFDVRLGAAPANAVAALALSNPGGDWLQLSWRAADQTYVLEGNYAPRIEIPYPWEEDDTLSISIWQSLEARGLVIGSRKNATTVNGAVALS